MGVGPTAVLAVLAVLLGFVGFVLCVGTCRRQSQRWAASDLGASRPIQRKMRSVAALATLVLIASTLTPWVFGSAVGVSLPSTLWGLPWARWIIIAPAVVVFGLTWFTPWERVVSLRVITCLGLWVCTGLGGLAMVLVAFARSASRTSFVADTLLRGVGRANDLVPVIRTGVGAPIFTLAALSGVWAVALNLRIGRAPTSTLQEPDFPAAQSPAAAGADSERFNPGDDWWH